MSTAEAEPPQYPDALPIGAALGEFVITKVIGVGGFGIVYMAHDTTLERTVAIKEYLPITVAGRSSDDNSVLVRSTLRQDTYLSGLQGFLREARLQARFSHPAMLEVYRVWEQNATAYMAMRYYPGRSLRDLRHDAQSAHLFEEASIQQIIAPVLAALEELHSKNVLHRDVSPDNILLLPTGSPVLLDFGSARTVVAGDEQSLTTVLKPGYAPLEQYADDGAMEQGPWTDVYGLGALLHYLAIGIPPPQPVSRLLGGSLLAFENDAASRYSDSFIAAVSAALAVKPKERLQTVAALRDALGWGSIATASTVPKAPVGAMPAPPPLSPVTPPIIAENRSRSRWWVLGLLLLLTALTVGGMAYFGATRTASDAASGSASTPAPTQATQPPFGPAQPAPAKVSDTAVAAPAETTKPASSTPTAAAPKPTAAPAARSATSAPVPNLNEAPAPTAKNPEKRSTAKSSSSSAQTGTPPAATPPRSPTERGQTTAICERLFAKLSLGNAVLTEAEQKQLPGCR